MSKTHLRVLFLKQILRLHLQQSADLHCNIVQRAVKLAAEQLLMLHLDRPITPLFRGQYDIRMVNVALKTLPGKDKIEISDLPKINPIKLPQVMHEIVEAINQIPPVPEYYAERTENR